jgi:hypothetical protein
LDNRIPGAHLVEIDAGLFGIGAYLVDIDAGLLGIGAYLVEIDAGLFGVGAYLVEIDAGLFGIGAYLVEIDAGLFGVGADLDEMRSDLDGASAYMLGFDDERVDLEQPSLTLSLGTEAIRLRAKDNGRKGVRVARGGDKKAVERISLGGHLARGWGFEMDDECTRTSPCEGIRPGVPTAHGWPTRPSQEWTEASLGASYRPQIGPAQRPVRGYVSSANRAKIRRDGFADITR